MEKETNPSQVFITWLFFERFHPLVGGGVSPVPSPSQRSGLSQLFQLAVPFSTLVCLLKCCEGLEIHPR